MADNKITYDKYTNNFSSIERIDFSLLSNEDILKHSAFTNNEAGAVVPELYNNNEPVLNGVADRRLGTSDRDAICSTCEQDQINCPGHFGHIKLGEPVFHMGYMPYVKNILSCICIKCGKLLVHKNENEIAILSKTKSAKQRFQEIRNACKKVTVCSNCGLGVNKIKQEKKDGNVYLVAEPLKKIVDDNGGNKSNTTHKLSASLCYDILDLISREDCLLLGFDIDKCRPKDMIIKNFPVPPIQVRPSIKMESSGSGSLEDDLTHKLVDIIKTNQNLKDSKASGELSKASTGDLLLLQIHVTTFYDNKIQGLPKSQQKNKRETKSMSERLKGKEGRIRGNLMGKRVDMSGRTVITSDPCIPVNGIGIPLPIAMNLTYPEVVTPKNIDYLRTLVVNGQMRRYPGANFVIKNKFINGREEKRSFTLRIAKNIDIAPGDIVERHLVNGDIVLFNRQPSLHKMSMMAHRAHIINDPKYLTFRVNVSVTGPYNADGR